MSQDDVEVVRRFLEANRSDDVEGATALALELAEPNSEYTSIIAAVEPRIYRGADGIREYFRDLAESFEEWRNEVEEIYEVAPDTVFATIRTRVVGKASGVPVEARLAFACVLSGGKFVRGGTYLSREEALEAVGLRE
jgi:ketosteroid isomerase-like protein